MNLAYPQPAVAVDSRLIISEVHPAPSNGQPEFIELHNQSSQTIQLYEYQLWDQISQPTQLYTFSDTEQIATGEFLVIKLTGSSLNNSGDGVELRDDQGAVITSMVYNSSQSNQSWHYHLATDSYFLAAGSPGTNSDLPTPTPIPSPSPTPSPSATPTPSLQPTSAPDNHDPISLQSSLVLTEVMACPESGENEWIEVYNAAEIEFTDLELSIIDAADNTRLITANLPSNEYTQISWSGSLLNNSGDSLVVRSSDSTELFTYSFDNCLTKSSWSKIGTAWQQQTPSPGEVNPIAPTQDVDTPISTQQQSADATETSPETAATTTNESTEPTKTVTTTQPLADFNYNQAINPTSITLLPALPPATETTSPPQLVANIPYEPYPGRGPVVGVILGSSLVVISSARLGYDWYLTLTLPSLA